MRFVLLLIAIPVLGSSEDLEMQKVFIPFEPYVEARREEYREEWFAKYGCDEQLIEAMLDGAAETGYIFSEENVASAFTAILDSDQLNISCMNDPLRIEFLSVMSTNTVMVKTVLCDLIINGLQCMPPVPSERYFLIDPGKNFELSNEVTFEEAQRIVNWFRHEAGTHLTEDEKNRARQLSWRAVIGKDGAAYTFRAGDPFCECVLSVRLDVPDRGSQDSQITPVEPPQFICLQ